MKHNPKKEKTKNQENASHALKIFIEAMGQAIIWKIIFLLIIFFAPLMIIYLLLAKSPLSILIVGMIFGFIAYLIWGCSQKIDKLPDLYDKYNIKYNITAIEEQPTRMFYVEKNLNIYLSYFEKFATVSALITASIMLSLSEVNPWLKYPISFTLTSVVALMYFHYTIEFCLYIFSKKPINHKNSCTNVSIILTTALHTVIVVFTLVSIIILGLTLVDKEKLFCHTDTLKQLLPEICSIEKDSDR